MKYARETLFFSVIAIFIATAIVTLGGITGKLAIPDRYLNALVGALIIQLAASVVGLFKSTDWFGASGQTRTTEVEGCW